MATVVGVTIIDVEAEDDMLESIGCALKLEVIAALSVSSVSSLDSFGSK